MADSQAVKALYAEFSGNFASPNSDEHHSTDLFTDADSDHATITVKLYQEYINNTLDCTSTDIKLALACCANLSAGPDGISFKLSRAISAKLKLPQLIIYQQSLLQGKFFSI